MSASSSMTTAGSASVKEELVCDGNDSNSMMGQPFFQAKKVHFNPKVRARYTLHINNYTPAEIAATWPNGVELAQTRQEIRQTLQEVQNGTRSIERGLETRTKSASTRSRAIRNDAKAAMLDEQALQKGEGEFDPGYTSFLYAEASYEAKAQASIRGLMDELVAHKIATEPHGKSEGGNCHAAATNVSSDTMLTIAAALDRISITADCERGVQYSEGDSKPQTPLPLSIFPAPSSPSAVVGRKRFVAKKLLPTSLSSRTRRSRQTGIVQGKLGSFNRSGNGGAKLAAGPPLRVLTRKAK